MDKVKTDWDLAPLFKNVNDPLILKKRKEVEKVSYKFINKWKKRSDYLKDPKVLKTALDEYENWLRFYGAAAQEWYFFNLLSSLDQNDPMLKAKYGKVEEFGKKIQNDIQFFELNLAKIDSKLQKKFLTDKTLEHYKHFLEKLFSLSKYLLSDPEEKIMNLKSAPAHDNWIRMVSGLLAKEEKEIINAKGEKEVKNFSEILGLINSQNKKVRDAAAEALNAVFEKYLEVTENEINSVLQNKKINDDLRKYVRPDQARHINDDIDTQVVDTLVKTVSSCFDISKRFYTLKAKLFGVKKLAYHERNVEYGKVEKKYPYQDSIDLIGKVFEKLDLEFLEIFRGFIDGRVDVYPKKGKVSGAFAIHNLITQPSYLLLNHTNQLRDVTTFAHELGHGINYELIRKSQNALHFGVTVATAEVASTFMEDYVLQELTHQADDELKLSLLMSKLSDDVSSIFRQIAFYNFEMELHKKFRNKGYLSKEEIGAIFQKHMMSYMGPSVEQSAGSQNWWVYVSHFRYFFYVYSYTSGLLISKTLQASVKKNPQFISKVKEFLSAGLSDSPKNIFAKLGVDITDKNFWLKGLSEVESLLKETEALAKKLGKI